MPDNFRPYAACLALVLVVCSEAVFFAITDDPLGGAPCFSPTVDEAIVMAKRDLIAESRGAVVFVGDSSCLFNIVPDVVQEHSGYECVNLGTFSSFSTGGFEAVVREVCLQRPRPQAVVIAVVPKTLNITEREAREWKFLGRYLVAYGQTCDAYAPGVSDGLNWFFYKHRFNRWPGGVYKASYPAFRLQLVGSKGHWTERPHFKPKEELLSDFDAADWSTRCLESAFRLARSQDVPVALWLNPKPEQVCSTEYLESSFSRMSAICGSNEVVLLNATRIDVLGQDQFTSESHLSRRAAETLSRKLAGRINDWLYDLAQQER